MLGWIITFIIVYLLIDNLMNKHSHRNDHYTETGPEGIGEEKIIDGYYWWNVGYFDEDHWVRLGPVEPIYFLDVQRDQEQNTIHIAIDYEPFGTEDFINYFSCHSAEEVVYLVKHIKSKAEFDTIITIDNKIHTIREKAKQRYGNYEI